MRITYGTLFVGIVGSIGFLWLFITFVFSNNSDFDRRIRELKEHNASIRTDIAQRQSEYDYYTSELYKDKYAKRHLNKVNPGEAVIAITDQNDRIIFESESEEQYQKNKDKLENVQKYLSDQFVSIFPNIELLEVDYKSRAREMHLITAQGGIWFNLTSKTDIQIMKLKSFAKQDLQFKDHVDLRVSGKVFYR